MAIEPTVPASRRAVLLGAVGAAVASVASALGRPAPMTGTNGGGIVLGSVAASTVDGTGTNEATSTTGIATTAGTGFSVRTLAVAGGAITGTAESLVSTTHGVQGTARSTSGTGVRGIVTATTGATRGVEGRTASTQGIGVIALASAGTGLARGLYAETASIDGEAINANASAASGTTIGVESRSYSTSGTAIRGRALSGLGSTRGVLGVVASPDGVAVQGYSGTAAIPVPPPRTGVHGFADQSSAATGVKGESIVGTGVVGTTGSGVGVRGASETGVGVLGESEGDTGVFGSGSIGVQGSGGIRGVYGISKGDYGTVGQSQVDTTGVLGFSGSAASLPIAPSKTGVYGHATQDSASRGVYGFAMSGQGVRGEATTGTGGYFSTPVVGSLHTGTALRAVGRVRFDRCVGVATIQAAASSVLVTPSIDLVTGSAVVATLLGDAGGSTAVQRVAVDATANTFTIHLTAATVDAVKVAWHVFG